MYSFNLGVRAHDFHGETLDELFSNISEKGIRTIQFAPRKSMPYLPWDMGIVTPELGSYIKSMLDKYGLRVSVLGCYINPSNPNEAARRRDIECFKESLMLAKYIGAGMVATETGAWKTPALTNSEGAYQTLLATVRELLKTAEGLGVNIGIEPVTVYVINSCAKMKRLLSDADSENLTIVFDPINAIGDDLDSQYKIIDDFFSTVNSKISAIHLKDRLRDDQGRAVHCTAGKGLFDFRYFFDKARECKPFIDMLLEETAPDRFSAEKENLISKGL